MTTADFYNQLSPFYHLIFADWEASIQRQAHALDSLIREFSPADAPTVLDVACGIGTQALGLAALGYHVTASDLSPAAVQRAQTGARKRGLQKNFSIADMRAAHDHHQGEWDVVFAFDNSVPHLLSDADILTAFQQFYACTRPGGLCLISVRDYDAEEQGGTQVKPYGLRVENGVRFLAFQVWEWHAPLYDLSMYLVEDRGDAAPTTRVMRSTYYAVSTAKLIVLMQQAGFTNVQRLDYRFSQPVIISRRP